MKSIGEFIRKRYRIILLSVLPVGIVISILSQIIGSPCESIHSVFGGSSCTCLGVIIPIKKTGTFPDSSYESVCTGFILSRTHINGY